MSLPFTSVVSYHTDPLKCGVAKFNQELAQRLGVPMVAVDGPWGDFPLLSLKWSEVDSWPGIRPWTKYGVFWHDAGDDSNITMNAQHVFYANPADGSPGLWCPGAPLPPPSPYADVRLFSYGMAHKLHFNPYRRVKELLDVFHLHPVVRVSVAIHEGTDLNEAALHFGSLAEIFGSERVRVQGCLSDMALREELEAADAVVAFFPEGVKANNTTVHTAMSLGRPVITNLGPDSPKDFIHNETIFDIARIDLWPTSARRCAVGRRGAELHHERYAWPHLLEALRKECDNSR